MWLERGQQFQGWSKEPGRHSTGNEKALLGFCDTRKGTKTTHLPVRTGKCIGSPKYTLFEEIHMRKNRKLLQKYSASTVFSYFETSKCFSKRKWVNYIHFITWKAEPIVKFTTYFSMRILGEKLSSCTPEISFIPLPSSPTDTFEYKCPSPLSRGFAQFKDWRKSLLRQGFRWISRQNWVISATTLSKCKKNM